MRRGVFSKATRRLAALAPLFALAIAAALVDAGCADGRFPVCKTNDDCAAKLADAGSGPGVCYNLRCVECRYDTDCPSGKICNSNTNACDTLSTRTEDPDLKAKPAETSSAAEAKTWDECATTCKDPACIKGCDQRFKK